jgi:hypothetical protein
LWLSQRRVYPLRRGGGPESVQIGHAHWPETGTWGKGVRKDFASD